MGRHELSDEEWAIIQPLLPNKPRGVPRVDDRRVLNGILWRFRTGAPWRDIPERDGPRTTLYNRFVRWRAAGVGRSRGGRRCADMFGKSSAIASVATSSAVEVSGKPCSIGPTTAALTRLLSTHPR